MKFVLVQDPLSTKIIPQVPLIGGYYNWPRVFDGEYRIYAEVEGRLAQYDVVMLVMNHNNLERATLSKMREELGPNSKTKIVASVDYSVELWKLHYNLEWLGRELLQADIITASEPIIQMWTQAVVYGKKPVQLLVHPTDVARVQTYRKPAAQHGSEIVAMLHDYDNNWQSLYLVTRDIGLAKTALVCCNANTVLKLKEWFDYTGTGFEIYAHWLEWLSARYALVDSYHNIHTYGRGVVDCACLGLPHIATSATYLQPILFPELTTIPGDVWSQRALLKRLLKDRVFYNTVVERAAESVEFLGYNASRVRFQNLLEGRDGSTTI